MIILYVLFRNPRIWTSNYTGESRSVWISKLNCYGTEDDIASCSFPGWGKGSCQSSKNVNIGCGKIFKKDYTCDISKELICNIVSLSGVKLLLIINV